MLRSDVEAILNRYYEAFNALDPDAVAAVFTDDCVFHDHALDRTSEGLDALRAFVRSSAAMAPDLKLEPHSMLIEEDQASVELTMSGSAAESGARWSVRSSSRFWLRGDKIRRKEDNWNLASVLEQIGMIRVPDLENAGENPGPEERNERARALAKRLWGIEAIPETSEDGFLSPGLEHLFGEIWMRPGLAIRDRSLITVAALTALAREQELRFHMRGALSAGVRPDEIRELVLHLAYYAGYPVAAIARRAAAEVLPSESPA